MKQKRPLWRKLLLIPAMLVVDLLLLILGAKLDSLVFSGDAPGHGFPLFSVLLPGLGVVITAFVILIVFISCVVALLRGGKKS